METPVSAVFDGALITLGEPLIVGAHYVVRGALGCMGLGSQMIETDFVVAAAAPAPSELGALSSADIGIGPVSAITYIGSCSLEVDSDRNRVELTHAASAAPWRDAMLYETWVDGRYWRPNGSLGGAVGPASGSWFGRGVDIVYAVCFSTDLVEPEGLPEGVHAVELRARIAGETEVLTTPTVSITLDCTGYEAPDGGGAGFPRSDVGPSAGDASAADSGMGETVDAGMDAGASDAGGAAAPAMGCRAVPGAGRGWLLGLGIALGLAVRRWAR